MTGGFFVSFFLRKEGETQCEKDRWTRWKKRWERLNKRQEVLSVSSAVSTAVPKQKPPTHTALGGVVHEPGLGRSLSLALFSWTETREVATEGSQRRKTGQNGLPSTTLDQPTKTAMECARRVLGDELINNWTPRCLQTSVFSRWWWQRFTSSSHNVKYPQGHLCPIQDGA